MKSLEIELSDLAERVARENYETNRQRVPGETSWDDLNVSTRRLFARAVKNKIVLAAPDIVNATLLWAANEADGRDPFFAMRLRRAAFRVSTRGEVLP